jgi:hypothetical protein
VVREHVYHPDFQGGFGLKAVLPALTGRGYDDLDIGGGGLASMHLARLVLGELPAGEREALRRELLAYCRRDTEGLAVLLQRLRQLALAAPPS